MGSKAICFRAARQTLGLLVLSTIAAVTVNYCCGLAGVMGFKQDFHQASIKPGGRLVDKIKEMNPEVLVTDCLSCRLQFNQLLPFKVLHPVEILLEAYRDGAQDARFKPGRKDN